MPSNAKRKLQSVVKSLKKSKTYVGMFSHFDKFIIKAKKFSFLLVCKMNVVAFYVTRKTFEIFDPSGFLNTLKCLKSDITCKLASFAQDKEILCNSKLKDVCPSVFTKFIKLRDSGTSYVRAIKKLL